MKAKIYVCLSLCTVGLLCIATVAHCTFALTPEMLDVVETFAQDDDLYADDAFLENALHTIGEENVPDLIMLVLGDTLPRDQAWEDLANFTRALQSHSPTLELHELFLDQATPDSMRRALEQFDISGIHADVLHDAFGIEYQYLFDSGLVNYVTGDVAYTMRRWLQSEPEAWPTVKDYWSDDSFWGGGVFKLAVEDQYMDNTAPWGVAITPDGNQRTSIVYIDRRKDDAPPALALNLLCSLPEAAQPVSSLYAADLLILIEEADVAVAHYTDGSRGYRSDITLTAYDVSDGSVRWSEVVKGREPAPYVDRSNPQGDHGQANYGEAFQLLLGRFAH